MLEDIDYTDLDPGIRETVRFLRQNGFDTTDSGDGTTKFTGTDEQMEGILPFAHVAILIEDPITLTAHADRLRSLLEKHGIVVQPNGFREVDPSWVSATWDTSEGVEIEATYDPANNIAVILLRYLDDKSLSRAGIAKKENN